MSHTGPHMKEAIQATISELMERILRNVLVRDPFIYEKFLAAKPLYAALAPEEIFDVDESS